MNDDQSGRGTAAEGGVPETGAQGAGTSDDALRSLARLEALSSGETPPKTASRRRRPRVAATSRPARSWARVVAPVAFLVAVIVVVSLAFQSGVVGDGADKPTKSAAKASKAGNRSPKPSSSVTRAATAPGAPAGAREYIVRAGDTLSGIAARFDVTVTEIEGLNADRDLTTLHPGQSLAIPPK